MRTGRGRVSTRRRLVTFAVASASSAPRRRGLRVRTAFLFAASRFRDGTAVANARRDATHGRTSWVPRAALGRFVAGPLRGGHGGGGRHKGRPPPHPFGAPPGGAPDDTAPHHRRPRPP